MQFLLFSFGTWHRDSDLSPMPVTNLLFMNVCRTWDDMIHRAKLNGKQLDIFVVNSFSSGFQARHLQKCQYSGLEALGSVLV